MHCRDVGGSLNYYLVRAAAHILLWNTEIKAGLYWIKVTSCTSYFSVVMDTFAFKAGLFRQF